MTQTFEPCGIENSDYPGEYSCTLPKDHGPFLYINEDGVAEDYWDHAAPKAGAWWNNPEQGWTPTVNSCDNYMADRTGKYEWRKVRYDAAIEWMKSQGLRDGMTVVDLGAGMTEFAFCLMHDHGFNVRYIPIDGGIDGTDLNEWQPQRDAHFVVALELIEHMKFWRTLVNKAKDMATIGVVLSTPDPRTTDVIGMDPTHVCEVFPEHMEGMGFNVESRMFYGGAFSEGKNDSLLATWRK